MEIKLVIYIISCNRIEYLNSSIISIKDHLIQYEENISNTFINIDQGTIEREQLFNYYELNNIFFLNPSGYSFSFQILFSFLYSTYILLLEEDWIVKKNIEKKLKFQNFLYISILTLSQTDCIYGLYLRHHPKGKAFKRVNKKINLSYLEVYLPWKGFCYTNGVSIYKTKYLKRMQYKRSEYQMAQECMKRNFHIGLINWELKKSKKVIQYVFEHIGLVSTRVGLCNISLY